MASGTGHPGHRQIVLPERVLAYTRVELERWKRREPMVLPPGAHMPPGIRRNQPSYGFGEAVALRHYVGQGGWEGYSSYALGHQYPGSRQRMEGRRVVEQVIPADRLAAFRAAREGQEGWRSGKGEPDLFLHRNPGEFMFVEVKKEGDRIGPAQFACLATIIEHLGCPVEIVYAREVDQSYTAKRYLLDINSRTGRRLDG